jgi:hypothetical protein
MLNIIKNLFYYANMIFKFFRFNKKHKNQSAIFDISGIIDKEDIHDLVLSYKFPFGVGKISSTDSVLGKPLDNLLNNGSPIEKLVYILYQEKKDQSYYFVGTFILTTKRLLFFPAINISEIALSDKNKLNQCHLHHLTLESNLSEWHITVDEKQQDRGKKIDKYRTKKIDSGVSLWFVMCLSSENHMVKLPKELEIKLTCPSSKELRRRLEIITVARNNCDFPITSIGSFPNRKYFLNFEFFLTSSRNILKEQYFLPPGIFTVTNDIAKIENDGKNNLSRSTPIRIDGFNSLLTVRTSKIEGQFNFPALFISGHKYE